MIVVAGERICSAATTIPAEPVLAGFTPLPGDRGRRCGRADFTFKAVLQSFLDCKEYATLLIGFLVVRAKVIYLDDRILVLSGGETQCC
jgi:hypothetical protein